MGQCDPHSAALLVIESLIIIVTGGLIFMAETTIMITSKFICEKEFLILRRGNA
jgi:hypothetical protein